MRKMLIPAFAVCMGLWCPSVMAQAVGEVVAVRAVCKDRALVERHVKWVQEDGNYDRANAQFLEAAVAGECTGLPEGLSAMIEEVGHQSAPFVDKDGDLVQFTAIKVRGYWTMYLSMLSKKT